MTSNPVTGGWWLYALRADDAAHPWLPDYPKMGIWPDGLYMATNMFDCTRICARAQLQGRACLAFDRADLYAAPPWGDGLRRGHDAYFTLLPSNFRGAPAARLHALTSSSAESDTAFAFKRLEVPRGLRPRPPTRRLPGPPPSAGEPTTSRLTIPQHRTTAIDSQRPDADAEPVSQSQRHRVPVGRPHRRQAGPGTSNGLQCAVDQRHRRHDRHHAGATGTFRNPTATAPPLDGQPGGRRQGNMAIGYSASSRASPRLLATTAGCRRSAEHGAAGRDDADSRRRRQTKAAAARTAGATTAR